MLSTKTLFDFESIRKDFPILQRKVHGKPLIYLDNAATSQKPKQVIDAIGFYYKNYNANIHRSIHTLGEEATAKYEEAHEKIADFINADSYQNIILTKNTTESLNLAAYSLTAGLRKGDEIVISQMEHHSNFVPWQQLAQQRKLKLKFIKIDKEGKLDNDSINENINRKTKIVSVTHVSNVLGTINPVEEIAKIAHENGAVMVVDGAQSVPHMPVDVKNIDADFYAFSGHKMLGPTGIGVLYGKKELLEEMQPFIYGGGMIRDVKFNDTKFNELPWKFEAGTPDISGAIGLGIAVDYLKKTGMSRINGWDNKLMKYAMEKIQKINGVEAYGPRDKSSILSFNLKGVHAHDVAQILDSEGVAIRAGHHCCMPLMGVLGVAATARASFYLYNTEKEIDTFINGLHKVKKVFGV
ncbi:MAG: cysteine desulfurase [Nanoarchaeota archaeon]